MRGLRFAIVAAGKSKKNDEASEGEDGENENAPFGVQWPLRLG